MSQITESSIKKAIDLENDLVSNVTLNQGVILKPGQMHTFFAKPGREYIVSVTNISDSGTADVAIWNMEWNTHLVADLKIPSLRNETVAAEMDKNGIRVYNQSKDDSTGNPRVLVNVYSA